MFPNMDVTLSLCDQIYWPVGGSTIPKWTLIKYYSQLDIGVMIMSSNFTAVIFSLLADELILVDKDLKNSLAKFDLIFFTVKLSEAYPSRSHLWIDYLNIELASHFKNQH